MAIAENISNANTPGYKAGDVTPFESVFDGTRLAMVTSNPLHIGRDPTVLESIKVKDAPTWEVHHSGNSVSLEQELIKANEVNGDYSMNRSILKSFHRMLMASLKG